MSDSPTSAYAESTLKKEYEDPHCYGEHNVMPVEATEPGVSAKTFPAVVSAEDELVASRRRSHI